MAVCVKFYCSALDVCWIIDSAKAKEKPRVVKGCQSSRSAYMLVYRLRSLTAGLHALNFCRIDISVVQSIWLN